MSLWFTRVKKFLLIKILKINNLIITKNVDKDNPLIKDDNNKSKPIGFIQAVLLPGVIMVINFILN